MWKYLSKLPEWRILGFMGIIALGWYLLSIFGSVLNMFTDVLLILFLAWIMAFLIEPLVTRLESRRLSKTVSAAIVYFVLAVSIGALLWIIFPTTVTQLSQLSSSIPNLFDQNSLWTSRIEGFVTSSLANSVNFISGFASAMTLLLMSFILSFYFLVGKKEISKFILQIIPDQYEEDYLFLENVLSTTFASFLRLQVILGLAIGALSYVVLLILGVNFALSSSIFSGLLAMVPVVGSFLFIFPPILAALTTSPQKVIFVVIVLVLLSQLVYNVWAPRLMGKALKIHPIVVLLSFVIGYKFGGVWGAVFAVPVIASISIIGKDLMKYWNEEADSNNK